MTVESAQREEVAMDLDAMLLAAGRGDAGAFEAVYTEVLAQAHRLALQVVRDSALAEDVTQEALVEAWRTAPRFDPERASARAWILMIVRRRAIDRVRREQRQRDQVELEAAAVPAEAHQPAPQEAVVDADFRAWQSSRVRDALARLTDLQREAVELAFYGGRTHTEVAAALDVPLGTAKTRIRDGLARLRDTLKEA